MRRSRSWRSFTAQGISRNGGSPRPARLANTTMQPTIGAHWLRSTKGNARAACPSSGFNVDVSDADGVLEKQARDAVRFLKSHAMGLARLRRCKTFGGMTLDFGVYDRTTAERPWPTYRFPAPLIELAGKLGVELELSFYGVEPKEAG